MMMMMDEDRGYTIVFPTMCVCYYLYWSVSSKRSNCNCLSSCPLACLYSIFRRCRNGNLNHLSRGDESLVERKYNIRRLNNASHQRKPKSHLQVYQSFGCFRMQSQPSGDSATSTAQQTCSLYWPWRFRDRNLLLVPNFVNHRAIP